MTAKLVLVRNGRLVDTASAGQMQGSAKQMLSAGLLVQNYCNIIQKQQILQLPVDLAGKMPPIADYMKEAKENSYFYTENIEGLIIDRLSDITGFATRFERGVDDIIASLQAGNVRRFARKQEVLDTVDSLEKAINTRIKNVDATRSEINKYKRFVDQDIGHFREVFEAAQIHIEGDKGAIQALDDAISKYNTAIALASGGIVVSALGIIGGVLMIAVGTIASFVTAGTSTGLAVAGGVVVAAGVGGLVASSLILSNAIDAKAALYGKAQKLRSDMVFITNLQNDTKVLGSTAEQAATALTAMSTAWAVTSGMLKQVRESVEDANDAASNAQVIRFLQVAKAQWVDVKKAVQTMNDQMTGIQIPSVPAAQILTGTALVNLAA